MPNKHKWIINFECRINNVEQFLTWAIFTSDEEKKLSEEGFLSLLNANIKATTCPDPFITGIHKSVLVFSANSAYFSCSDKEGIFKIFELFKQYVQYHKYKKWILNSIFYYIAAFNHISYDVNKARLFRKVWLAGSYGNSAWGVLILRQLVVVELINSIKVFIYILI